MKYDEKKKTFVEPYLPNHEIGIIHFAGKNNDEIRKNKNILSKIECLDSKKIKKKTRINNELYKTYLINIKTNTIKSLTKSN